MIEVKEIPAPPDLCLVRRALISVFDKAGLVPFTRSLHERGVEVVSTGGTARVLRDAGLPVRDVSELTGFPEILDGRVKTLHPLVHGALLARRSDQSDLTQLEAHGIAPIDLVVVNLYPFSTAAARPDVTDASAIENIDIGGPTMVRAAAKNFFFVGAVTSPKDYDAIISEMDANEGHISMATRRRLARDAFEHTAHYDAAIYEYFDSAKKNGSAVDAARLRIDAPLAQTLRYGENPHQNATLYGTPDKFYRQLHGKALSFNNLLDLSAAASLISEYDAADPTIAILKHTNPCGVAMAGSLVEAYERAFATDRQSPFGGIVVANRALDRSAAEAIDRVFTEIVIAPEFEDGVLGFLQQKKNRRIIQLLRSTRENRAADVRSTLGGFLVQDTDQALPPFTDFTASLKVVTKRHPTDSELRDLDFAWRVVKAVKSNAIVYAKHGATIGIGAGQMSRIDASEIAVAKGAKSGLDFRGSVVASDAFFPFADGLAAAAQAGAVAAIQPGGSVRDEEVINAADNHGMAMVFTGSRHFRH